MSLTATVIEIKEVAKEKASNLEFGVECYNKGAEAVLRPMALLDFRGRAIQGSKQTLKLNEAANSLYEELLKLIREEDRDRELLDNYDDTWLEYAVAVGEDHYVAGFIQGYMYFKNYIELYGNNPIAANNEA